MQSGGFRIAGSIGNTVLSRMLWVASFAKWVGMFALKNKRNLCREGFAGICGLVEQKTLR
jgi:hypothetical protein